jgi:TP53 regulating kinase-like protein
MVDATDGVLGTEWIEGKSVRMLLGGGAEGEEEQILDPDQSFDDTSDASGESLSHLDPLEEYQVTIGSLSVSTTTIPPNQSYIEEIAGLIGSEIAKMHKADIIHGDLTTSNMIIRHPFAAKCPWSAKLVCGLLTHRYYLWSTER